MTDKLISRFITVVIGLALIPIMQNIIEPLVSTGGAFETGPVKSLLELLPFFFVIVLIVVVVAMTRNKN